MTIAGTVDRFPRRGRSGPGIVLPPGFRYVSPPVEPSNAGPCGATLSQEGASPADTHRPHLPTGDRVVAIGPDGLGPVMDLARAVDFLPKTSWSADHRQILPKGLASGSWIGLAAVDGAGRVASYLDYKLRRGPAVEVGFCMTRPDRRGEGLAFQLLSVLVGWFSRSTILVSTHESNVGMLRVVARLGFDVREIRPGERINGETSLYLRRVPQEDPAGDRMCKPMLSTDGIIPGSVATAL